MIRVRTIALGGDGRISEDDHGIISRWWVARGSDAPPRYLLPTLGVIIEADGVPIASAFCYLDATGSGVAWLGWMITDPAAPALMAGRAMKTAVEFLEKEAARLGYWLMWATVEKESFVRFFERRDYEKGDTGLCHLFHPLLGEKGAS
jgi:hypothetical protein